MLPQGALTVGVGRDDGGELMRVVEAATPPTEPVENPGEAMMKVDRNEAGDCVFRKTGAVAVEVARARC